MIMCLADVRSLQRDVCQVLSYVSMLHTEVVNESSVVDVPFLNATCTRCRTGLGPFVSYCNRKDFVMGTTDFTFSCGKGETLLQKIL
jgi:hypothetical protein